MAKEEFINNLRAARNLFIHPHVQSDVPALDPGAKDQLTARAAIWLSPKSIKGFNAADFPELDPRQRTELQASIDEFLRVTKQLRPKDSATPEQLGKARAAFEAVLSILHRYLATSPEEDTIEAALKDLRLPPWVVNWDYELGSDQDGEPAIWLNLFIAGDETPRVEMVRFATRLTSTVREVLSGIGSDRWPFIQIRAAVEHMTAIAPAGHAQGRL